MQAGHILIIGQTASGKSVTANHIINNILKCKDYILVTDLADEIKNDQVNTVYSNINKKNITNNLSNKVINKIKKYTLSPDVIHPHHDSRHGKKLYIVIDDLNKLINSKSVTSPEEKEIIKQTKMNINFIFTEGRHLNIYCIALVQYYKILPPLIRVNSKYHIVTFGSNQIIENLFDHVSHYFDNIKELKDFIYSENVNYTSICFDTHTNSRDKKDNIFLICASTSPTQ